MVWLLGHRQPKGAVNGDARPTATAPHFDSTVRRRPGLRRQRRQHLSELTFRPQRQQGAASPTFLAKRSLALDGHNQPPSIDTKSSHPVASGKRACTPKSSGVTELLRRCVISGYTARETGTSDRTP